jgi:predicted membrane channel-forming protein YqfA (hemolysin III family)
MMFIGLGLSGVVPVIHGAFIYGFQGLEDRMSLSWVVLHGAMYIFGAVLYAVCLLLLFPPSSDSDKIGSMAGKKCSRCL